jgi:hypothetical protein
MKPRHLAFCALGLVASASLRATAQQHAHSHGTARLNIAIESQTGVVELIAAAADLYGFEGRARTDTQRQTRESALARLRSRAGEMVVFEPALGCALTPRADSSEVRSEGHDDVRAVFDLKCARAPAGRDIRFGVTKLFPSIRTLEVQLLSDTTQVGRRVIGDQGTVRP